MVLARFRVVLDADVLFPFALRDTLLRAAALGMYQATGRRRFSMRLRAT